ncbi:MAG: zinc ribbon domain-containing protein [Actinobacteria bacterium]|nr:MAG: zinc ribbon domain-containing protein [Actinomycetota bacterium]
MPTYEYKCSKCEKTFELLQGVNEKPVKTCQFCDGEVSRVFHPVGVIYKGSGFYTTDYKKKEAAKPSKGTARRAPTDKPAESCKACDSKKSCPAAT